MGLIRATILITCYAIFPFKHWLPVAVTTGLTSAFIIIKVGHFQNLSKFKKDQVSLNLSESFKLSINPIHFSLFYKIYIIILKLTQPSKVDILRFYFSSRELKVNYLNTFSFWLPSPCVGLSCTWCRSNIPKGSVNMPTIRDKMTRKAGMPGKSTFSKHWNSI